jgi:CheY-like chemotaxis protein
MSAEANNDFPGPLKVLHVDDDPLNQRVVNDILTAFGFSACQASSGAEALEQLGWRWFDVVLMDIHMPGMTGVEVVRRLRRSVGPEKNVPVIALTADVLSRTPAQYIELGFDDFLSKPIEVMRLKESLLAAARGESRRLMARKSA